MSRRRIRPVIPRALRIAASAAVLALALGASAAPAANAAPDPRVPRCSAPVGGPQTVVLGEATLLSARCVAPDGSALAATALWGSVDVQAGRLVYRADDATAGYDKITVFLAASGAAGPSTTVLVRVVER